MDGKGLGKEPNYLVRGTLFVLTVFLLIRYPIPHGRNRQFILGQQHTELCKHTQ